MNRLLTAHEAGMKVMECIERALNEVQIPEDERPRATIEALDALNRMLGGPGVEAQG